MISFKDNNDADNIRQGGQSDGKLLTFLKALGIVLGVRQDELGSLTDKNGGFTASQYDKVGHIKSIMNHIDVVTSNAVPITAAATNVILQGLQNSFYYRLYFVQCFNLSASTEIVRWDYKTNKDSQSLNRLAKGLGLNGEQLVTFSPGYVDLAPGTGLNLITVNGGASIEWSVGYSLLNVE